MFASLGAGPSEPFALGPPPGPFVGREQSPATAATHFRSGTPVIATTYFYWYDVDSKAHILDADGSDALTEHPPTLEGLSYKNVDWHAEQLSDMMAAGIDVALPVYWGVPTDANTWSDRGLPKLVAAREKLLRAGKKPPAIGMFYDTSTLQHNGRGYHADLTTPSGRDWFYGTVRNFFSYVPSQHRAHIDGKPLVFLYTRAFAKDVDETLFPAVRKMFREDFGSDIFLVKMRDWPGPADSEYQWGAALAPQILKTAAVGPGYDHAAVPGRRPLVRRREGGSFYRFAWQQLLSRDLEHRPWLVHLETWNEFHEGTEICETAEFGRQYIELTRHFADLFHARKPAEPQERLSGPVVGSASPGKSSGIEIIDKSDGDGPFVSGPVAGKPAWQTTRNIHSPHNRYLYFDVDNRFLFDGDEALEVTVEYFDAGPKSFIVEYDSCDPDLGGLRQKFRPGPVTPIEGSKTWKRVILTIPHARFAGRANGVDFRLTCTGADLAIGSVSIRRHNSDSSE